jgi:hypothetical protein
MPLPENIDGLSRAKLKLLLVKLLEEVADLRRAVARYATTSAAPPGSS